MATLREEKPGVWEVRVFTGPGARGRPTQLSRTVHGGTRDALKLAAELEVGPGRASPAGRSFSDVLDAWVGQDLDTWAPSSARDQQSRVRTIKKDQISRRPLARLSVSDVERWHTRMRRCGLPASRICTGCCALRFAAVAGARRAELAALQWTDVVDGQLTIDSAIEFVKRGDGAPEMRDAATKTANTRTLTLDPDTLALIESVRVQRHPYGRWMFGLGPELVSLDRIGWWWSRSRKLSGIDAKWRLHDLRHWSATVAIGQRYLMDCVLTEAKHLASLRVDVEGLVLTGGRVHFHNESSRRRRNILARSTGYRFPPSWWSVTATTASPSSERASSACL